MDEFVHPAIDEHDVEKLARTDGEFVQMLAVELPRVQRIARLMTGNADAAEEVVAEAVARMLPRWRGSGIDDCGAYLRRVVVNLVRRRWRRLALASRRDHHALGWATDTVGASSDVIEDRDRTLRAVTKLPTRRRAVVVLRFYDDLAEADIAEVLGISVGTVKSQLARAPTWPPGSTSPRSAPNRSPSKPSMRSRRTRSRCSPTSDRGSSKRRCHEITTTRQLRRSVRGGIARTDVDMCARSGQPRSRTDLTTVALALNRTR